MSSEQNGRWEARLQQLADEFVYPPTPPVADRVTERLRKRTQHTARQYNRLHLRPLWAFILLMALLIAGLWRIPTVRATVVEWLELGAVRIWLVEPADVAPLPTETIPARPPTPIRRTTPTAVPLSAATDLAGETTLEAAQNAVDFAILLPKLPADLGKPDHVYLQRAEGDMVILVWMQPEQSASVRMSLHLLGPGAFVWKMQPADTVDAQVNGSQAFWTEGPYYIKAGRGQSWGNVRLVEGHVLIWADG
ncbi:MAG: hypothetical protein KDE31_34270, partial [Caldilineaceae bacterium]|nr:hypothetical protein [Caldilineaceae bacterium]